MPASFVDLDHVDGWEFQGVCKRIFEGLGYARVDETPLTSDEGKDLIVWAPDERIIVECKHQPGNSIGRPVIQKLHSAILSENSRHGMVITTGDFSPQARSYAEKLLREHQVLIDLVDRTRLADMATRAGIKLVIRGRGWEIQAFPTSPAPVLVGKLAGLVEETLVNQRRPLARLMRVGDPIGSAIPCYWVVYGVDAVFETGAGVIHHEQASGRVLLYDGRSGALLDPTIAQFLIGTAPTSGPFPPHTQAGVSRAAFAVTVGAQRARAVDEIIAMHTRNVHYTGRNNQSYSKVCAPGPRQITIEDFRPVYLPVSELDWWIMETPYRSGLVERVDHRVLDIQGALETCRVCGSQCGGKRRMACEHCGRVGARHGWLRKHARRCASCRGDFCIVCVRYRWRWLVFKDTRCPTCITALGKAGASNWKSFTA